MRAIEKLVAASSVSAAADRARRIGDKAISIALKVDCNQSSVQPIEQTKNARGARLNWTLLNKRNAVCKPEITLVDAVQVDCALVVVQLVVNAH